MKFDIETSLGYSSKKYKTEAGNGTAIPQYKQDEHLGRMIPLLTKDKKRKTFNLYKEIQKHKASTDYKQLIEKNDMDLEKIKMIFNATNPKEAFNEAIDYTNFGTIETYKALENKIIGKFGSMQAFNEYFNKKIGNFNKQLKQINDAKKEAKKAQEAKNKKDYQDFLKWKKEVKK